MHLTHHAVQDGGNTFVVLETLFGPPSRLSSRWWCEDFPAAARAGDAGTNDVYLTALAHAITEWANTAWPRAADVPLPVMVPVNLRTADEAAAP
ncbi:hypothetical protein PV367_43135, partial [Streptomyces europaeiscabiei]|nr:hypothetical protein [Streptomyces europaeiscabiei]